MPTINNAHVILPTIAGNYQGIIYAAKNAVTQHTLLEPFFDQLRTSLTNIQDEDRGLIDQVDEILKLIQNNIKQNYDRLNNVILKQSIEGRTQVNDFLMSDASLDENKTDAFIEDQFKLITNIAGNISPDATLNHLHIIQDQLAGAINALDIRYKNVIEYKTTIDLFKRLYDIIENSHKTLNSLEALMDVYIFMQDKLIVQSKN